MRKLTQTLTLFFLVMLLLILLLLTVQFYGDSTTENEGIIVAYCIGYEIRGTPGFFLACPDDAHPPTQE